MTWSISDPPLLLSQVGVIPSKARSVGLAVEEQPASTATRAAEMKIAFSFDTSLLSVVFDKFTRRSRLGYQAWPQLLVGLNAETYEASFR